MNLKQCLLTNNDCYKAGKTITPKGVMVHSTGANNPNLKRYVQPNDGLLGANGNNNDWNRPGISTCVHAFIGKLADGSIATYQTLPWNRRGWHCGSGGNDTHISFEICEGALSDATYFNAVYQEAVELTAHLCNTYGLNPSADGVVICHSEGYKRGIASNHADVMHWFPMHGKSMDTFRADVKAAMGGATTTNTASNTTTTAGTIVKVTDPSLNIRSGPSADHDIVGVITDKGSYTIVEVSGNWGRLKSGKGWIHLGYTTYSGNAATNAYPVGKCTGNSVNVRSGPGTNYGVLRQLNKDNLFDILAVEGDWTKVNIVGLVGYVYSQYVAVV